MSVVHYVFQVMHRQQLCDLLQVCIYDSTQTLAQIILATVLEVATNLVRRPIMVEP